ncbi:MAG TPA: hypothetical protein VF179_04525, partial [Thermoanaerobaculia bacterium]|nr:hypothetical protein [Thermoanaerobaculia bacterium]
LAQRQEEQASEIRVLQVLLKGIVNEFQLEKLRGINGDEPFLVRYHPDMFFEVKDLDAKRFVKPRPGYGVNSIHDHVHDPGEFDLKKYFQITDAGREYLEVRDALVKEQQREAAG